MASHVLVTMQVTTQNMALGSAVEERLAALVRECFDTDAEHASISVQAYDPDAPATDDDVCATCGCLIGDAEHAEWHRQPLRALGIWRAGVAAADPDEPKLRTFGEEPCHAQ